MSIILQSSGGGSVTIAEPTTASNFTQTLPAAAGEIALTSTNGAWTSYTPTISSAIGTITTASATGQYQTIGKTCIVSVNVTITTAGTGLGQLFVTLPFTSAARIQSGTTGGEFNATGFSVKGYIPSSSTQLQMTYYSNSTVIASGNFISTTTTYEIA
jgi:hypothetical protein